MDTPDQLLFHADRIAASAEAMGCPLLVIGAVALAGHHYVRLTRDVDLAGNVPLSVMRDLAEVGKADGFDVDLRLPDAADPLGGVLDLQGPCGLIQVISFADRFPAVIEDALTAELLMVGEHHHLRMIPLPHLIVLKLYAGGFKSKADIIEVLSRNPKEDLDGIEALCRRYRLSGFKTLRKELGR